MINFFRKIRQKLLSENRVSKYLIYGIGEILLVVIGILIALQVNNWNEERKLRALEKELLQEYQEELEYNSQVLANFEENITSRLNDCRLIKDAIEKEYLYVDSLSSYYYVLSRRMRVRLSYISFETLESQGIEIVNNKALKKSILELHNLDYRKFENRVDNADSNVKEYSRPIVRKKLKALGNDTYIPVDYQALMNDVEMWNIILTLEQNILSCLRLRDQLQEKMKMVDQMIQEEIN